MTQLMKYDETSEILNKYNIYCSREKYKELERTIERALSFNHSLVWDNNTKNIFLASTPEDLIGIYALRSKIYAELAYDKEFPDTIKGLNFDSYDEHSAILYTKREGKITGTCRVIFDLNNALPMDKNFPLNYLRNKGEKLAELSRLMIDNKEKGLSQEPKYLTKGAYLVMQKNDLTTLMSVMVEEHFKLYDKFGGFKIEEKIESYSDLGLPFIITSWNISEVSLFFKKIFLSY